MKGWAAFAPLPFIKNFKERVSLHNMRAIRDITAVDHMTSVRYPENFKKTIEKDYTRQEVFNIDETDLFQ
jgi:hypothetical protein